ncbi:unnamed protein product [Paramecium primaurelia]|uniref:BTB domain-containing protein n=1 Tax=Paramecium primaurelia TaxID=5886 RepID=A0A8S1JVG2_PARPR|nr:unnamed protein product [Paramecium primaurelia]
METNVIDLGKQVPINLPFMIQLSFNPNQQSQNMKPIQITYQYSKPINFYIYRKCILEDIKLKKIQFEYLNHEIIRSIEDFYLENQEPQKLFELFLSFIYSGKVEYRIREYYLPLLKLAIYFQCDILITSLMNQQRQQGIMRTFFLNFLCDIFNDQIHLQTFQSNPNSQKFLQTMIQQNSLNIFNHTNWHKYDKQLAQNKIQIAFRQLNSKLFSEFADVYSNNNHQNILHLTQLLYYIEKYQNPQLSIFEDIYLGRMINLVDENFVNQYQEFFTQKCKNIFEKQIKKISNQPYHMQHTNVCDLVNKSFTATCSHKICLNCFYQYLIYRSKFKQYNKDAPKKVRCLTRFLNKDICDCVFQDQDFLELKEYNLNEFLNIYLKQKI